MARNYSKEHRYRPGNHFTLKDTSELEHIREILADACRIVSRNKLTLASEPLARVMSLGQERSLAVQKKNTCYDVL